MNNLLSIFPYLITGNQALVITAILSLTGVLIAAVLNYVSNIKTNKSRSVSIDKRAKLAYLRDVMNILNETKKQLNEKEPRADFSRGKDALRNKIMEFNVFAFEKLMEVEPFLEPKDRDKLMARYNDIEKRRGELQVRMLNANDISNDDAKVVTDLIKEEIELRNDFKDVLKKETTMISDALRNQIDIW